MTLAWSVWELRGRMGDAHSLTQMAERHQQGPRCGAWKQTIEGWDPVPLIAVPTVSPALSANKVFTSIC